MSHGADSSFRVGWWSLGGGWWGDGVESVWWGGIRVLTKIKERKMMASSSGISMSTLEWDKINKQKTYQTWKDFLTSYLTIHKEDPVDQWNYVSSTWHYIWHVCFILLIVSGSVKQNPRPAKTFKDLKKMMEAQLLKYRLRVHQHHVTARASHARLSKQRLSMSLD